MSGQVIQAFRRPGHGLPIASAGQARVWHFDLWLVSDGASTCRFALLQSRAERAGPVACGDWGLGRQSMEQLQVLALEGSLQRPRANSHPTSVVCLAG